MKFQDYYEVMGVERDASQADLKKAYRKLARKYHPDVSKETDAEVKFKQAGEAYEVLKDPEKRAAYDQLGANWEAGQDFRPPPDWAQNRGFGGQPQSGFSGGGSGFSDFFEDLFGQEYTAHAGGHGRRASVVRADGQDAHARISIDIRDSYKGATRAIQLQVPEVGDDGYVRQKSRSLNVKIPKGIRPGQQIRLKGQGGAALGSGRQGDLYLEVEFLANDIFYVEGSDVFLTLPVAPWEVALGDKVSVPVPSGTIELKIPPGSVDGKKMRVKGKGLPGKNPGDFYVILKVVYPGVESEEAKRIYTEMRDTMSFDPRAGLRS